MKMSLFKLLLKHGGDEWAIAIQGRIWKGYLSWIGMIAAITQVKQISCIISRRKLSDLKLVKLIKIDIIDHSIDFQPITFSSTCGCTVDVFRDCLFASTRVNLVGKAWCIYWIRNVSIRVNPRYCSSTWIQGTKHIILSTLDYLCKRASKHSMPNTITLDQQLFWKASEIANVVPDDSSIKNVVLLLESFQTFMNLLGATSTLMDSSEIKEILETVYSENAVVQSTRE